MSPAPPQAVSIARRHFLEDRVVPEDLVPRPILRSWVRCAGLGLHMAAPPRVEPVTASELRQLRERHDRLRRACRPEIEALHTEAASTDSIVILTDASGMVLDRAAAPTLPTVQRALRLDPVSPGVNPAPGPTQSVQRSPTAGRPKSAEQSTISNCTAS